MQANTPEAVIETHGLRRVFKSRKRVVEAVAGVDLTVSAGEIFGVLGPNGAGKTTTLRMLTTLLPPSGGSARVSGFDLLRQQDRVREHIGYVGQAGGADREITGRVDRSADGVDPIFTSSLPILLLSGVLLPMQLAPQWLRSIAAVNPLLYAVDAARHVFNDNLSDPSVSKGVLIMVVLSVVAVMIGARQFGRAIA
jgi:hypothetical protein